MESIECAVIAGAPARATRHGQQRTWAHRWWGSLWIWLVSRLDEITPTEPAAVGKQAQDALPSASTHSPAHPPTHTAGFEAFFRQHEHAIFSYLYRMTGEEQTAYDLSQEAFLRAWQRFERISGYERPAGWLFRVATNLALNELRGRASPVRATRTLDGGPDGGAEPARSDPAWRLAERLDERDAIREALLAMPPRQRAALVLREVYGLSGAEVAAALGVSQAAAKMLLSRSRAQFRHCYQGEEGPR